MRLGRWCYATSIVLFLLVRGYFATLIDLGNMLRYMTNRNPLDFVNYGNWCGLGGSGYAVDQIDRCCKMHDFCYDKAIASVCIDEKPHLSSYKWKYAAGKIHCNKHDDHCSLATCRCDGKFSACVQVHQASYDSRNKRTRIPVLNIITNRFIQLNKKKK